MFRLISGEEKVFLVFDFKRPWLDFLLLCLCSWVPLFIISYSFVCGFQSARTNPRCFTPLPMSAAGENTNMDKNGESNAKYAKFADWKNQHEAGKEQGDTTWPSSGSWWEVTPVDKSKDPWPPYEVEAARAEARREGLEGCHY